MRDVLRLLLCACVIAAVSEAVIGYTRPFLPVLANFDATGKWARQRYAPAARYDSPPVYDDYEKRSALDNGFGVTKKDRSGLDGSMIKQPFQNNQYIKKIFPFFNNA